MFLVFFLFKCHVTFYLHTFVMFNLFLFITVPPVGSHGVMVSTLDSESSDPSSNLGGTLIWYASVIGKRIFFLLNFYEIFLY